MRNVLLVAAGGMAGSVARYLTSEAVLRLFGAGASPLALLVVNVAGCFAAGVIGGAALAGAETWLGARLTPEARLLIVTGVLGGFTTFSAFGFEAYALARSGQTTAAAAHVLAHVLFGLGAVWLGVRVARLW